MKNLLIIVVLSISFQINGYAQKIKPVPAPVRKAFSQKFPGIKRAIWDNSKKKYWEAEFRINRNEYYVTFDLKGKWIETEHEISKNEIPSNVKAILNKEFVGYKIIESFISETPKTKVYEIGLKKENEKVKVKFDNNGKVLKKSSGTDINDDDEDAENEEDETE